MYHKEGKLIIQITLILAAISISFTYPLGRIFPGIPTNILPWIQYFIYAVIAFFVIIILQFFRNPKRKTTVGDKHVVAPVDGKVVVIEEVYEPYLLQNGYLSRTHRGRIATNKTYKHLGYKSDEHSQTHLF